MLRSMKDLEDYAVGATDGTIGHVKDSISMTKRASSAMSLSTPPTGFQGEKC